MAISWDLYGWFFSVYMVMNSTVGRIGKDKHELLFRCLITSLSRDRLYRVYFGYRSLVVPQCPDYARLPVETTHCEPGALLCRVCADEMRGMRKIYKVRYLFSDIVVNVFAISRFKALFILWNLACILPSHFLVMAMTKIGPECDPRRID